MPDLLDEAVEAAAGYWTEVPPYDETRRALRAAYPFIEKHIRNQRDEELRERRKQGVAAMIRVFQDERGAIELTDWGPRFYRLLEAALDSIFEEAE